jgi:hypothetical protein
MLNPQALNTAQINYQKSLKVMDHLADLSVDNIKTDHTEIVWERVD